jgi:pimeloyl-ACP methyl ester carboxylesterase
MKGVEPLEPNLHVEIAGEGTSVVFHHGFGGSGRNFRPQVRALKGRARTVTFDARGHARSDAPEDADAWTLDALVSDFERVRQRAEAERVIAIGLSMGAAVALEYALTHPQHVSGVVLAAMPPGSPAVTWALDFADAIEAEGLDQAGQRYAWGGERFDAAAGELIRQGFLEHSPRALVRILRETLARLPDADEWAERAAGLGCPALVVVGAGDTPSLSISRHLDETIPHSRLVVIPQAGHVVNLQAPEAFNAAMMQFLSEFELL